MSPNNLRPGFISIDDAVALIKSDTRENPVVDMDWISSRIDWIDTNHNFRIPKVRRLKPEEVYRTRRGKIIDYESTGSVNVEVATSFDKELLKKTIRDKYRELVGHEYQSKIVRGMSTVADDGEGREAVKPRARTPMAKQGDSIGDHGITTTNGAGLEV